MSAQPRRERRSELLLHLAIAGAVAFVLLPVLRHPTQVLYSPQSDLLSLHRPYRHVQVASLRDRGRPQLFNPTAFGGIPLLGDPQAGLFYPPNWLAALTPPENTHAWFGWLLALHLLVGGSGVLWWLRGRGQPPAARPFSPAAQPFPPAAPPFPPAARLAGALAFVFCGKWFQHVAVAGHLGFLPLVVVPWQLGLVDRLLAGASGRAGLRLAAGLGLLTAVAIAGYQPQLLLYAQLLVAGYALFGAAELPAGRALRALGLALAGSALALAIAAIHWLEVVSSFELFVRGQGLPYVVAAAGALDPADWSGFLIPTADPGRWEASALLGALPLALAVFAPFLRDQKRTALFFAGVAVLAVVYALGERAGLHPLAYDWLPGFDRFRIPTRILLLLGLPLAFWTAAGVAALCAGRPTRGLRIAAGLLLAGAGALLFSRGVRIAGPAALALALPALVLAPWPARVSSWRAPVLVLILFAELARFAAPLVETRSLEAALGANPIVDALRAPLGEGRVLAMSRRYRFDLSGLPIAYATPAGLESLRGFNSLVPRLPYRYLKTGAAGERLAWSPDTTIPAFEIRSRAHLDLFNVRSIVTDYPLDVDGLVLRREFDDVAVYAYQVPAALHRFERTYLYENTRALPRAYLVPTARRVPDLAAAIAAIGSIDPRREVLVEDVSIAGSTGAAYRAVPVEHRGDEIEMSVDAGPGGYLVLSEVFYPGWRAEVDGAVATIHRANGIFQVLRLGPGEHRVRLRYRPSAYTWGRAISAGGLVLAAVLLLPFPRRRR